MHWTYRSEYVKCGNKRCKSCPHGPYWYRYRHVLGKMHKEYIGKENPFSNPEPGASRRAPEPWDAIHDIRRATAKLAYEILGINAATPFDEAKHIARRLLSENHPDRGGDNKRYCHINSAWTYLKSVRGWS